MGGVESENLHRDIGLTVSYCMDIKSVKEGTYKRAHKLVCTCLRPNVMGMHIMENSWMW